LSEGLPQGSDTSWRRSDRWYLVLFLLGAGLRIGLYLANRSLWVDEARVALNLLHKSPRELLGPLEFGQVAPPGFLLAEKAVEQLAGGSELALRLFPLLAGLVSLPLFFSLARRHLRPVAALLASLLFVISEPLIYYSTEVKQYGGDVTFELLLWLSAIRAWEAPFRWSRYIILGLAGAIAIFLSHAGVFVLAGIGLAALIGGERPDEGARRMAGLGAAAAIWLAAFGGMYALSLHRLAQNAQLHRYFTERLEGFPPGGALADVRWLFGRISQSLVYPGSLDRGMGALGLLLGLVVMFRRSRRLLVSWVVPAALALLAAAMRIYPFEGRLILFVLPALYLIAAEGMEEVRIRTTAGGPVLFAVVWLLFLIHPAVVMARGMIAPRYFEHIRPLLQRLSASRRPGDLVYIYYGAQYAVRYYLETRPLSLADAPAPSLFAATSVSGTDWYPPALASRPPSFLVGSASRENWLDYGRQLEPLAGHARVWIIFSHTFSQNGVNERDLFLRYLDQLGIRRETFEEPGASAYLYDTRRSLAERGSTPGG
jgi:hypothetical protein